MKGYEIKFNIYAEDENEANEARTAIIGFITEHAQAGRAGTGKKITTALSNWKSNAIVKNRIINYLKN